MANFWEIARLTICSLCNLGYFPFGFEGWILILIASVPGLCIFFTSRMLFDAREQIDTDYFIEQLK